MKLDPQYPTHDVYMPLGWRNSAHCTHNRKSLILRRFSKGMWIFALEILDNHCNHNKKSRGFVPTQVDNNTKIYNNKVQATVEEVEENAGRDTAQSRKR